MKVELQLLKIELIGLLLKHQGCHKVHQVEGGMASVLVEGEAGEESLRVLHVCIMPIYRIKSAALCGNCILDKVASRTHELSVLASWYQKRNKKEAAGYQEQGYAPDPNNRSKHFGRDRLSITAADRAECARNLVVQVHGGRGLRRWYLVRVGRRLLIGLLVGLLIGLLEGLWTVSYGWLQGVVYRIGHFFGLHLLFNLQQNINQYVRKVNHFRADNDHFNQQHFPGLLLFTLWHFPQTCFTSLQESRQKGTQQQHVSRHSAPHMQVMAPELKTGMFAVTQLQTGQIGLVDCGSSAKLKRVGLLGDSSGEAVPFGEEFSGEPYSLRGTDISKDYRSVLMFEIHQRLLYETLNIKKKIQRLFNPIKSAAFGWDCGLHGLAFHTNQLSVFAAV